MKIYIALSVTAEIEKRLSNLRILESYFYIKNRRNIEKKEPVIDWFIDSGAYSSFTRNENIDIEAYAKFIKEHYDLIDVYANLDAIGNPQQTQKNQEWLESQGLNPLPVFHYGEPIEYLKSMLIKYDYIALGGMVSISTENLQNWLDFLWEKYLTNQDGSTKIKIHGFGMTTIFLMERYPWYSVDSTSPILGAAYGRIYTPQGEIDISRKSGKIPMATIRFFEQEFPQWNLELLKMKSSERTIYNIQYMQWLEDKLSQGIPKFINYQKRLF